MVRPTSYTKPFQLVSIFHGSSDQTPSLVCGEVVGMPWEQLQFYEEKESVSTRRWIAVLIAEEISKDEAL